MLSRNRAEQHALLSGKQPVGVTSAATEDHTYSQATQGERTTAGVIQHLGMLNDDMEALRVLDRGSGTYAKTMKNLQMTIDTLSEELVQMFEDTTIKKPGEKKIQPDKDK
jgi:hypothetical protein